MAQLGMFATAGFVHAVLFWWGEGGCAFPFTTRNFDSADGYVALTHFVFYWNFPVRNSFIAWCSINCGIGAEL